MSKPTTSSRKSPSIKTITNRLKALQASFDTIHKFVEGFNEEHGASDVLVRLERIDSLWEQINDTVNELMSHDEFGTDFAAVMEERSLYENRYYDSKSFLIDKHKLLADPPSLDQTSRTNASFSQGATSHVRLPQITLPKFSGNIEEWISFRDLYTSLIHWQTDLPEVEKLHYLRSQLQGEALSVIEALPICSANYKTAWELLVQRYSNMKVIKRKQIQGIFDLPFLKRECACDLHTLLENFERIIKTLDQLVQPAEYKDLLLLHILSARLDSSTRRSWEEQSSTKDAESLKDLTDFLTRRIRVLEALPVKGAELRSETTQPMRKRSFHLPQASYSAVQHGVHNCVICPETHPLFKCAVFNRMGVSEREGVLRAHSLCRNCFYKGHQAKDCKSKVSCKKCRARHHTMVCFKANRGWKVKDSVDAEDTLSTKQDLVESSEPKIANVAIDSSEISPSRVLLATALVTVEDETGLQATARVLLDSGSECNFISRRLCQQFKTQHGRVQVAVSGIGQSKTVAKAEHIRLGDNLPKLIDTVFGWVVAGEYNTGTHQSPAACNTAAVDFLEDFLPRFWSCEEIGLVGKMSPTELLCEEQFTRTVQRAANGRYTVTLPKDDTVMMKLGESKEIAFRRLQGLERRLERDPLLRERYCQFLTEYLNSGHMRKVEEATDTCGKRYFLPHHPVVKESSTTTKVRVVFDASCRSTSVVSLNDGLIAGPVIQDDLRSIVFRCRTRQVMVVADIEKMFRQVLVSPADSLLQNILWRFDTKERPATYELNTITYGMKPSPYLATRTLRQLAMDEAQSYPFAARVTQEDIYMDDLISGADDLPSTCELTRQLVTMMHSGGFHLRKWASNQPKALEGIPKEDLAIQDDGVELDPDPTQYSSSWRIYLLQGLFLHGHSLKLVSTTSAPSIIDRHQEGQL
ncbi:uncharacterized protein LOC128735898 [Sabethes cyaneus]|uniref:uncharacterized protein LOC128735898 n=1 Tax=Sabethes cyaneus TaxID=53552 RepID=UPI00237DA730|nr:uncharacterized protein LOC128735898 [Sabethes cyaneus]